MGKGGIDKHDAIVGIGNHDGLAAVFEHLGIKEQSLLVVLAFGNVLYRSARQNRQFVIFREEGFAAFKHVLDSAIGKQQAVLDFIGRPVGQSLAIDAVDHVPVFRVDGVKQGLVGRVEAGRINLEDAVDLLRTFQMLAQQVH